MQPTYYVAESFEEAKIKMRLGISHVLNKQLKYITLYLELELEFVY